MAAPRTGNAIFSTDLGRYPVRGISDLPPRIILRSDPEEDVDVMIAELTEKYPAECKLIKPNTINLHEYFDAYDQQIHGALFLQFVLDEICRRNYRRRHAVLEYASDWVRLNPMAFEHMWAYGLEAFTADDLTAFGEDFLEEALEELRVRRIKHDDALGLAAAQGRIPNVEHLQQITRPSPVLPSQEQPVYFSGQRNSSAPLLLDMSSTRSPSHASTALTTQSLSLQGSRNSTLGRSNLATGMVPPETDNSAASATTKPTNQSLDPMADQANSSRFQGGFHDTQGTSTTQRQDEEFDDAEATGHHARPDTASTHHSQHADNRTSLANPVPHRLSTAPSRPYEGTASTRYSTEFQPGHGSRPRMTDDHEHIPPNRKVWIGGLLPDSDGRLLQQMLDPWKPSDVGPILCSTKAGGNKGYGGFAFAEFENPQKANEVIETLNRQFIESLQCKLFVRPAYPYPKYGEYNRSPTQHDSRLRNETIRYRHWQSSSDEKGPIFPGNIQGVQNQTVSMPSNHSLHTPRKRGVSDTNWPPLNTTTPQQGSSSHFSYRPEFQQIRNAPQSEHPDILKRDDRRKDGDHDISESVGGSATQAPTAAKSATTPKSKTPSPKKKKGRNANRDESSTEKTAKAKQRKEMLSNLRTEKSSAVSSIPPAATPSDVQDIQALETAQSAKKEQPESAEGKPQWYPPDVPATDPKKELGIVTATHGDGSSGGISGMPNASETTGGMNSASSTDPSSKTEPAQSESGVSNIRAPTAREQGAKGKELVPMTPGTSDISGQADLLAPSTVDAANVQQSTTTSKTSKLKPKKVQTSAKIPTAKASARASKKDAAGATHPASGQAADTTQDSTSPVKAAASASVDRPNTDTAGQNRTDEQSLRLNNSVAGSDSPAGLSGKHSAKDLIPDDVDPGVSSQLQVTSATAVQEVGVEAIEEPQQVSEMSPKRGVPKDPKVLVAVPKVPPLVKPSQAREHGKQGSHSSHKETISNDSIISPKPTDLVAESAVDKHQSRPCTPLEDTPKANEEHRQASPETHPMTPLPVGDDNTDHNTRQLSCAATDGQESVRQLDETLELGFASDSAATLEGDTIDSAHPTPQSSPTPIESRQNDNQGSQASEEQPVIQQKKKKARKGKKSKKSKKSASGTDGGRKDHQSGAAPNDKAAAVVPKPETPFLSDENAQLPVPGFLVQNHSSMISRYGEIVYPKRARHR
ncbi:MAG: hypothetical protein Q9202_005094 [Teloschistes flavicans]